MGKTRKIKTAYLLRNIARYALLIMGILVFFFALVSGSGSFGGGLRGIIRNSPNALPWLIFLLLVYVAWKWELIGGIIITLFGICALIFFVLLGNNFFVSTFILTVLIIMFGAFFIFSWYLRQ